MIIIQHNRGFTDEEFDAIDVLWKHHSINFPLINDLGDFFKEVLSGIHRAIMIYREPELVGLRETIPKLKNFKFNNFTFLEWQKKHKGFKRHAMGFSDDRGSRKAMKKAGLIVGDLMDITILADKMKEAQCRLHLQ